MKPIALLGPSSKFKGLQSDLAATEVNPGGFVTAENVRFGRQALETRKGATRRSGANVIAGGELVGYKVLSVGGTQNIYAAFRVGTETRCYLCTSFTSGGWTEISDASTRFTGAKYRVGFTTAYSAHLSTLPDKVIFGNGVDDCRVIATATKSVHPSTQAGPTSLSQTPLPAAWVNFPGNFTITNSDDTKIKVTASSAAALVLNLYPIAFAGVQTSKIQWATSVDYQGNSGLQRLPIQSQIGFVYAISSTSASSGFQFLSKVTAEGYKDSAASIPITSSTNASPIVVTSAAHGLSNGSRVYVPTSAGNSGALGIWTVANATTNTFELAGSTGTGVGGAGSARLLSDLVVYDVTNAAMSYVPPTQKVVDRNVVGSTAERTRGSGSSYRETGLYLFDAAHLDGYSFVNLTLHATSGPSSTATTVSIASIFSGGYVPGASIYAVSLAKADALSESIGVPATEKFALATQLGSCTTDTGAIYQAGTESFCAYSLRFAEISTANRDSYVLYRSEPTLDAEGNPGYTEFGYLTYGSLPSSNPFGVLTTKYNNTRIPNYAYLAKPDDHIPLPPLNVFATVNSRVFGAKNADPNLYVSRLNDPFSFSETGTVNVNGQVDFRSATKQVYDGGISGLLPLIGQLKGVNDLLSFTVSGVYRVGGFNVQDVARSTQVSNIGTPFTDAICYVDGRVCYLTSEREFVDLKSGYSLKSLSQWRVNNRFQAANLSKVSATAVRGQVTMAMGEASGDTSPNVALVYDQKLDLWVSDRYVGFNPAGLVSVNDAGVYRQFAITDNGELWELETGTTENAAAIPVVVETGVIGPTDYETAFGRAMLIADSAAVTFTVQRNPFGNPGDVSNISAQAVSTATGYRNVMYDRSSGGTNAGVRAYGCQVRLSYSASGGHLIYAWTIDGEDRSGRAKTNG